MELITSPPRPNDGVLVSSQEFLHIDLYSIWFCLPRVQSDQGADSSPNGTLSEADICNRYLDSFCT